MRGINRENEMDADFERPAPLFDRYQSLPATQRRKLLFVLLGVVLLALLVTGVMYGVVAPSDPDSEDSAQRSRPNWISEIAQLRAAQDQQFDTANTQIESNTRDISAIQGKSGRQEAEIIALRQVIEGLQADLEVLRQGYKEWEEEKLKAAQKAEKPQTVARQTRRSSTQRRRRTVNSGFQLVSIDTWDGKPSVVLRANGGLHTLETNSRLEGWTIEEIDVPSGSVRLRDGYGRRSTITRDGH